MIALAVFNPPRYQLEHEPQSKLNLSRDVRLRIKQRLIQLTDVGGHHSVQPGKRPGNQVQRAPRCIDNSVRRNAVEVKHVIDVVEIDVVEDVRALHDGIDGDATLTI